MARPVDPAIKQKALRLLSEGATQATAAEACGVSQATVSSWARASGIQKGRQPLVILSLLERDDEVRRPTELRQAMVAWQGRVRRSSVVDVAERALRSSWDSDGTQRSA